MNKGFWLSLDAFLALFVVFAVLLSLPTLRQNDFTELAVLQKQHDLLKVWQATQTIEIGEMRQDARFVFPNQSFELAVENETVEQKLNAFQPNASTVEGAFWISPNEFVLVSLTVYH